MLQGVQKKLQKVSSEVYPHGYIVLVNNFFEIID